MRYAYRGRSLKHSICEHFRLWAMYSGNEGRSPDKEPRPGRLRLKGRGARGSSDEPIHSEGGPLRRRIAVCSIVVVFLAVFGTAACAGGETQEEIEVLEERVELLEDEVQDLQLLVGAEVEEEPPQEQTQQEELEDTQ